MPSSLKLLDFKDSDLFYALEEAYNEEGWATSKDVAEVIGITGHKHPAQCVGSRFGYLKGAGILESQVGEEGDLEWRLSEIGEAVHHSRMTRAVERALEKLTEGQFVTLIDHVAQTVTGESRSAIILSKRAWTHQIGNWKDPSRNGRR